MTAARYLSRLVERTLAPRPALAPRLPGLYEHGQDVNASARAAEPPSDDMGIDEARGAEAVAPSFPMVTPGLSRSRDAAPPDSPAFAHANTQASGRRADHADLPLGSEPTGTETMPSPQRPVERAAPLPALPVHRGERSAPVEPPDGAARGGIDGMRQAVDPFDVALPSWPSPPGESRATAPSRGRRPQASLAESPDASPATGAVAAARDAEATAPQSSATMPHAAPPRSRVPDVPVDDALRPGAPRVAGALVDTASLFATPQGRNAAIAAAAALVARRGGTPSEAAGPTVHVVIGRVELRLPAAAPQPAASRAAHGRPAPRLHDYLQRRDAGERP